MDRETFEQNVIRYLLSELEPEKKTKFEDFLSKNRKYGQLFDELQKMWNGVSDIEVPQPSDEMQRRFYHMLQTEKETKEFPWNHVIKEIKGQVSKFFLFKRKVPLAYGIMILGLGMVLGYLFNNLKTNNEEVMVNSGIEEIREKLVLTLLKQPSAVKRLEAVNEASRMQNANHKVIEALFITLENDPNINVRLASVESLSRYASNPEVREGLVRSIAEQESPMLQIVLAKLMVKLQEKESIEPIERLLERDDVDDKVKQKLRESINLII
ncbi:HEAT repeat domain-containing protein [Ulvibacterium sp.]|uniref:HEAT repeat domain-containing protein n=1 Tax=Ulvibacterium sp. TaxID=2665914 RepID=UPI003BA868C1